MSELFEITLGPTFGEDVARIRGRSCALPTAGKHTPIFELALPLKLHPSSIGFRSDTTPYVRFRADPENRYIEDYTVSPDRVTISRLLRGGSVSTSVDSLSRSLVHQPASETALLRRLERQSAVSTAAFETVRRHLLTPLLTDQFSTSLADDGRRSLTRNVRAHETQHVRDLIDPETAMWKELELLWQLQLVAASPGALDDEAVVNRLAVLYSIPRRFLTETAALAAERFDISDPDIESFLREQIAEQRGTERRLLQLLRQHCDDREQLSAVLECDAAEQFGDLWLLYVIQSLKRGRPISDLDSVTFFEELDSRNPGQYIGVTSPPDTELCALRSDFTDFVYAHLYGPAFEVISFDTSDAGEFVLRRRWYNTNPTVTGDDHLLAVRRALFLRAFMRVFRSRTALTSVRTAIEKLISRALAGYDVSLTPPLFETDAARVAHDLKTSIEAAGTELVGTADRSVVARWLDDPTYVPSAHS